MSMKLLEVTDRALASLKARVPDPEPVFRVGVKAAGCGGYAYDLAYVPEEKAPFLASDDVVEVGQITILIDKLILLYVLGMEIDWQEDDFYKGFVFRNPNEKGRCGCGESFFI